MGGGQQTVRLAGRQIESSRLPRLSLWVDLQRPWFPPEGEMRLCRSGACGSLSAAVSRAPPPHSPPPASPERRDWRRQARCNRSLRYAGQPLPRT